MLHRVSECSRHGRERARCAIVAAMKNRLSTALKPLLLALLLAAGGAHAQFKAPTKSQSKDALGSGIGSSSIPAAPATPGAPAATPAPKPGPADSASSAESVVQAIADCLLPGLPSDWTMAQIDVREIARKDKERSFEAIYSYLDGEGKAGPFTPCDAREPALNLYKLNGALEPAKRNWVRATLVFSKEGKFELQYDYAPADAGKGSAPAAPAAPVAAKKDAKKAAKKE